MKVLISGPVETESGWETLAERVRDLHTGKHGPFDLLIVVPNPLGPSRPANIHFPVQVVWSSGVFGEHFCVQVALSSDESFKPSAPVIDVLVTDVLPTKSGAPSPISEDEKVANWALASTPRYHFCGSSKSFYQRAPYRNTQGRPVTRLIALAAVGSNDKWIHALSLGPLDVHAPEPQGTTDNPYLPKLGSKSAEAVTAPGSFGQGQYFFAPSERTSGRPTNEKRNRKGQNQGRDSKRARIAPRQDCWFCLASSTCEQHLIAHIGEELYIALPKGGIRKEHVLIVPISHEPNFSHFVDDEEMLGEVTEMQSSVEKAFKASGYGTMYTDRSLALDRAPQMHGYLEALPVPLGKEEEAESLFRKEAHALGLEFVEITSGSNKGNLESMRKKDGYLFIQLPSGKAFVHKVKGEHLEDGRLRNAILTFGRIIACSLLACPERANWKSCVGSKAQETDWTKTFTKLLNG